MRIYFCHGKDFDYRRELYAPIRASRWATGHDIVFPYEASDVPVDSLPIIRGCDLAIAEVSSASTGLGIELGWAHLLGKPIVCVHRDDARISGSLRLIAERIVSYHDAGELLMILEKASFES
jgi:nucleoside 2-deoxyribosyltransferase